MNGMETILTLIHSNLYYTILMPALVSILCVVTNRLNGRTENACPTWKDKLNMFGIYFACWFINMFFIWLLMLANEVWLAEHWGVKL